MSVIGEGAREVLLQRSSQGCYPAWPWPRQAGAGEPEKIRLICFVFGANSCIPSQLFSLSILVSERINFHLQSRELHRDRIHIPVNSLSHNADRSSHSFNQNRQPCETLDSCSHLLNFFDNPGQSLIQSAKYLLSWYRIGRYLQCPPRKEPPDIRFATSPTHPSYSRLRTSHQGKQVPQNPGFSLRRWCQLR